ncbi:MAG: hypothetical protein GY719_01595 [bacterium]|nr:hypothetical protein [bacterium]
MTRSLVQLIVAALAAGGLAAQQPAPNLEYSPDPGTVVVQYTHIHHMLAQRDPQPLMRIYGDGRVRVHYPVYSPDAGDYELRLTPRELRELLHGLAGDGIMDFDQSAARQQRQQAVAAERAAGRLHYVSDATETVIGVRLEAYGPAGADEAPGLEKAVRWLNVYTDSQQYPDLAPVRAIAAAETRLRTLLERSDLTRVR